MLDAFICPDGERERVILRPIERVESELNPSAVALFVHAEDRHVPALIRGADGASVKCLEESLRRVTSGMLKRLSAPSGWRRVESRQSLQASRRAPRAIVLVTAESPNLDATGNNLLQSLRQ